MHFSPLRIRTDVDSLAGASPAYLGRKNPVKSALIFHCSFALTFLSGFYTAANADEVFGPPNLLKTFPTPFSTSGEADRPIKNELAPLSLQPATTEVGGRSILSRRLISCRVYFPGRCIIGKPAEFVIKGRPGYHVAIAMADKNSGARPIAGHAIRLGADRKLMTLGTIPDSGVLSLFVDVPIQGDLIGQHLYFETAVWSRADFSDLEIASPVKSEIGDDDREHVNGVVVSAEAEQKRGIRFVPDSGVPLNQRDKAGSVSLDSGRP